MEINQVLERIMSLRQKLDGQNQSTNDLLRFIPHFRLDWGQSDGEFSDDYNIGATKPILISGLAIDSHKIKMNSLIFEKSEIAKELIKTFIREKKLTKEFLLKIHGLIMPHGGKWRQEEVMISDFNNNMVPPFCNHKVIEEEIQRLVDWYNEENMVSILPPLYVSCLFHYNLVKIHPFIDGNGRLARILSSMILLEKRIPPPILKNNDRKVYLSCLRNADSGDILPLISFVGEKVIQSLEYMVSLQNSTNV